MELIMEVSCLTFISQKRKTWKLNMKLPVVKISCYFHFLLLAIKTLSNITYIKTNYKCKRLYLNQLSVILVLLLDDLIYRKYYRQMSYFLTHVRNDRDFLVEMGTYFQGLSLFQENIAMQEKLLIILIIPSMTCWNSIYNYVC